MNLLLVFCFSLAAAQFTLSELNVQSDLIIQHAIAEQTDESSQITCDHMVVEHIQAKKVQIDQIIQTRTITLQYISPDPQLTASNVEKVEDVIEEEEPELLQKRDIGTIRFHGNVNFKKGVIHSDGVMPTANKKIRLETEFIQVDDQSQWVEVQDDISWSVKDSYPKDSQDAKSIKQTKQYLKHTFGTSRADSSMYSVIQHKSKEHALRWAESQKQTLDQHFGDIIKAGNTQIITLTYDKLPEDISYIMLKAKVYLLSNLISGDVYAWAKVDGKYAWVQPMKGNLNCKTLMKEGQQQLKHLADNVWNFPVTLSTRHVRQAVLVEFGVTVKGSDVGDCTLEEQQLLFQLRRKSYLFGLDGFELYYR